MVGWAVKIKISKQVWGAGTTSRYTSLVVPSDKLHCGKGVRVSTYFLSVVFSMNCFSPQTC